MQDRPVTLKAETYGGSLPGSTSGAGKRLVLGPAAIVAKRLAGGRLSRPGMWPPEQVIHPEAFFDELAERGFVTHLVTHERVAGE